MNAKVPEGQKAFAPARTPVARLAELLSRQAMKGNGRRWHGDRPEVKTAPP
jgi:hypothetical protein